MINKSSWFPPSYEASRERFRQSLARVKDYWPSAHLHQYRLTGNEDVTIDWISAEAVEQTEKTLIFTTAEHGIEGFVGSAMLAYFFEHFLNRLTPENTDLLLVHTINPWGMKHLRRTNANNVDLNRNFVWRSDEIDPAFNLEFARLAPFLTPAHPVPPKLIAGLLFQLQLWQQVIKVGFAALRAVSILGHYHQPKGIHYGGDCIQEETRLLMSLYKQVFRKSERILHLDMHTGWGPRYQMSLVNSFLEDRGSKELTQHYSYPQIVAAIPDEFYAMRGDMIDYIYTLREKEHPNTKLFATSFEFGTLGNSKSAVRRGMRAMILENQTHWFGVRNRRTREWVAREFLEMFYPQESKWQAKALADAELAFDGILQAEGYLRNH
ncbi:MAG: DUF2817 domain-containing protein [Chloroflexi bacterium]|nr:DUF2817 domain-containing protein [Chloroflexota bacterium]